jgi:hypothetical protein
MNLNERLLVLLLLSVTITRAGEFKLYGENGVGPIVMDTRVVINGNTASFTGTARNQSGRPIRYAAWCVQARKQKSGCTFRLWTTGTPWNPGEVIKLEYAAPKGLGFPKHFVSLTELRPVTRLDPVHKIFVGSIQGESGNLAREQLMALISNSVRFQLVEERTTADATLAGIAEPRGEETKVASTSASSGTSIGSASASTADSASAAASGSVGTATGATSARALESLVGRSAGKSVTDSQRLVSDVVVLRLTLPTGEIIWAWDDTGPCDQSHTRCAFDDLAYHAQ